jgi:hypothetical protein
MVVARMHGAWNVISQEFTLSFDTLKEAMEFAYGVETEDRQRNCNGPCPGSLQIFNGGRHTPCQHVPRTSS